MLYDCSCCKHHKWPGGITFRIECTLGYKVTHVPPQEAPEPGLFGWLGEGCEFEEEVEEDA